MLANPSPGAGTISPEGHCAPWCAASVGLKELSCAAPVAGDRNCTTDVPVTLPKFFL